MKTNDASDVTFMNQEVSWQVELRVKPGKLDHFRALTHEMVEHTKGEAGVLIYERFISEEGGVVYVYERYTDSTAAVAHLQAFREKFGERFTNMVERKRFTVFGRPSEVLRKILDPFGATYPKPLDGFSRS